MMEKSGMQPLDLFQRLQFHMQVGVARSAGPLRQVGKLVEKAGMERLPFQIVAAGREMQQQQVGRHRQPIAGAEGAIGEVDVIEVEAVEGA